MVMKDKAEQTLTLNFNTSSLDILLIWGVSCLPLHASPLRPPRTGTHESVTTSLCCSLELEIYPQTGEICVFELPVWGQSVWDCLKELHVIYLSPPVQTSWSPLA